MSSKQYLQTASDTNSLNQNNNQNCIQYYRKIKYTGVYKEYDQKTRRLIEEGFFDNGQEVGLWKVYDNNADQQHFRYRKQRIGALCKDGSHSTATGRGACSWHGGVQEWLYENARYSVGGTGKYAPPGTQSSNQIPILQSQNNINKNLQQNDLSVSVEQKDQKQQQKQKEQKQNRFKFEQISIESEKQINKKQKNQQIYKQQRKILQLQKLYRPFSLKNLRTTTQNQHLILNPQIQYHKSFNKNKVKTTNHMKKHNINSLRENESWLRLITINQYNLRSDMKILYQLDSYEKFTIYGMNIKNIKKQLENGKKIKLKMLWAIYNTIGFQKVSFKDLQEYVMNYPSTQDQVEEITVQNGIVKFKKLSKSLKVDLLSGQVYLDEKSYEFNRFQDKKYQKSISKIITDVQSFQFSGKIRQIQSNQQLIAIRTDQQISIINLDWNQKTFIVLKSRQVVICGNRCYFIQQSGIVRSIVMQKQYLPESGKIALEETIYSDKVMESQFLVAGDNLILVVEVDLHEQVILIRKLQGRVSKFSLSTIQSQQQGQALVYRKAFIRNNYLHIVLILGKQKSITRLIEHRFLIN